MSGRLGRLLARPLSEHERQRAFAAVAVTLLLAAAALTLIAPPEDPRHSSPPATAPAAAATATKPGQAAERPPAAAVRAARRFLHDYLALVYGHVRSPALDAASPSLRRRITARPPRVSPAMRERRPHVVRLTGHRLESRSRWALTATVADGSAVRYPIELVTETRPRGGALVVALGEV